MEKHIVLVGDSTLDNQAYVGRGPAVIDQVRALLPAGWEATLLAVDGSVTSDVPEQLWRLRRPASHLIVSIGGNDALSHSGILAMPARSATEVFAALAEVRERFSQNYAAMLAEVLAHGLPTALCTVYDPNYPEEAHQRLAAAGLTLFNDTIVRLAVRHGLPLIDLGVAFDSPADYANPIEPSPVGGQKIARLIHTVVTEHDFTRKRTVVYA